MPASNEEWSWKHKLLATQVAAADKVPGQARTPSAKPSLRTLRTAVSIIFSCAISGTVTCDAASCQRWDVELGLDCASASTVSVTVEHHHCHSAASILRALQYVAAVHDAKRRCLGLVAGRQLIQPAQVYHVQGGYDMIMYGDSLTDGWSWSTRGLPVFQKYFGKYKVLNAGISGVTHP